VGPRPGGRSGHRLGRERGDRRDKQLGCRRPQGRTSSELLADLVAGARVVKAANTLSAEVLASDPREAGGRRVLFISGDDADAKADVVALFKDAGFATIDLGDLKTGAMQQIHHPLAGVNLIRLQEVVSMAVHTAVSPADAADRLALRELFDAYAHCADRREAEGQKALFTADTRFAVYMDGEGSEPSYVLEGREALMPVCADLNRYETTTHFNEQSTVTLDRDRATGESCTIAHHLFTEDGNRKIMIASLRYLDSLAKIDGKWYFAERKLILDWSERHDRRLRRLDPRGEPLAQDWRAPTFVDETLLLGQMAPAYH
jgi:hypothetical protein